ncbi:MAG: twin-arginine translocation signal domain-containing protein [Candidatus Daviesbacteria bacterium]|nr:twin-arginine translocation signal domain-containing protein [Candidatus Daviesbacteria bacterium]
MPEELISHSAAVVAPKPREATQSADAQALPERMKREVPRRSFLKWLGAAVAAVTIGGIAAEIQGGLVSAGLRYARDKIVPRNPESFTYDSAGGYIGKSNTLRVPLATIQEKAKSADPLTLLFPLKPPEGFDNIHYDYREFTLNVDPQDVRKRTLTENKNYMLFTNVPKRAVILAPTDGIVYDYSNNIQPGSTDGLGISFTQGNIKYSMGISASGRFAFETIGNFPGPREYVNQSKTRNIKKGEPLLILKEDNQVLQFTLFKSPGEIPVPIKFLTDTSGGNTKLLVLGD